MTLFPADASEEFADTFARAWKAKGLSTRLYGVVPLADWAKLRDVVQAKTYGADGRGDEWLRVGGLKGFVDGSLGSHTAAFLEPFTDAPNDTGLLLGRKDLIEAGKLNANPHCGTIGRMMKVSKEDMVALLAAVERFVRLDHKAEWRAWEQSIALIEKALKDIPTLECKRVVPPIANHVPHLVLSWDERRVMQRHIAETLPALQERSRETHRLAMQLLTHRKPREQMRAEAGGRA